MLASAITAAYGLVVTSVEPRQSGYAARSFDVHSTAGRFVAKVWRGGPPADAWVRLCDSLSFLGVPVPLATRAGERIVIGPEGPMCLQPFVSGATPPDWPRWPAPVLRSLGEFLAVVHATPPPPGLPQDPGSCLAIHHLNFVEGVSCQATSGILDAIAVQLERFERMREAIDQMHLAPEEMVVCHTDAGGDNILVGPDGRLVLIDWDEAAISFPEADFVLVARDQPPSGEPFRHVLQGYLHGGGRPLRRDRLALLMLRRYLGDALVRVGTGDREGIVEWGVRQWDRLDDALRAVVDI